MKKIMALLLITFNVHAADWWKSTNLYALHVQNEDISGKTGSSILRKVVLQNIRFSDFDWSTLEYHNSYLKDVSYHTGKGRTQKLSRVKYYFVKFEDMIIDVITSINSKWTYGDIKTSKIKSYTLSFGRFDNVTFDDTTIKHFDNQDMTFNLFKVQFSRFSEWSMSETLFKNSKFFELKIDKLKIRKVKMENSSLRNFHVDDSRISDFTLIKGDMLNTSFNHALISLLNVTDMNLQGIHFNNGEISNSRFISSDMRNAVFEGVTIKNTRFENINLDNAVFKNVTFINTKFIKTNTSKVKFQNVSGLD